jgi:hypothetical protein
VSASGVLRFPSDEHKFRPGVSPNPGGKPKGGRVVQRKRRALKKAAAVAEIINEGKPRFEGDGVDLLVSIYQDPTAPLEIRLACATQAAQYERSKRSPTDPLPSGATLEELVLAATARREIEAMTHEERLAHANGLLDRHRSTVGVEPCKLMIEAQPVTPPAPATAEAERQESIRQAEKEAAEIRAKLAERQAATAQQDHNARLRQAGIGFLRAGQRR